MPTTNTERELMFKFQIPTAKHKIWNLHIGICCLVLIILPGCIRKHDLKQAQDYLKQSQVYYQDAIGEYKKLINQGKDLDRLYLEFGKLYYFHGDFSEAIEAFKKTNHKDARNLLALSSYRMGNFTDALEIFNKNELGDSEYLYYYGLTCERLNLFDKALDIYKKIREGAFLLKARQRINLIEKTGNLVYIKDLSPQVDRILKGAPSARQYPQAGALILFCDEKIETTDQDTQTVFLYYVIKILNERGKEDFSETQIDYDSTYEKVELEYARTVKPDGTVVDVGSRHIRDVSKYLNYPLYSNARVFIISFPEITEGAVIEYKVKIHRNQLINKKDFVVGCPVGSSEPIIAANFSVTLPKPKPLHIKILNEKYNIFGANLKPVIKEEAGRITYTWQFKDIPQIIPESNMPPAVEVNPTILLSTFSNWQGLYHWWWQLAKDKIKPDLPIKSQVRELTKGKYSDEAKIRAIYNFCAKKIRYVAVEYGQAGYEPHYAGDIFKNKYGDCKDQAILLVTMLKEAGFESYPVLIATKEYYNLNADFPAMLFNHCIAAVYLKDELVFLDPTAQTCSFGDLPADDQLRKVFICKLDGYQIQDTPLYPAEHNLAKEELRLEISGDEQVIAQKSNFTYGLYDQAQRYWLLYTQPELIQEKLKETIQGISIGAKLIKYNIENLDDLNRPVVLRYEFYGPEYFTLAGNLRIMPQLAGLGTALAAKDKRKYPIDFGVLDTKEQILEITIPDNFIIKYIPQGLTADSPWLKITVDYSHKLENNGLASSSQSHKLENNGLASSSQSHKLENNGLASYGQSHKNNKIYFRQATQTKKDKVPEEEYPDFKKFIEGIAKKIKQRIVIERIK